MPPHPMQMNRPPQMPFPPQYPQAQYPNNMLYRNTNMRPQTPNYMYNQGMPGAYRNMGYPSHMGAGNPSYIGNVPGQYGYPQNNFNRPYPHPQQYGGQHHPHQQYNMQYNPHQQYYGQQNFYQQQMRQMQPKTPPLPARVDREK